MAQIAIANVSRVDSAAGGTAGTHQVWCSPPVLFLQAKYLVYTGAGASLTGPVLFGSSAIT